MSEATPEPTQATPAPGVRPAERVRGVRAYKRAAMGDAGVDLWLDANEGAPMPAELLAQVLSPGPEAVRRYPDASKAEAMLAERWGVRANRVVLTNGGDDAIDRVCRSTLEQGREIVVHEPSFEMIRRSAELAGGSVAGSGTGFDGVPWLDGPFPLKAMLSRITERTGLVALVSPNNPTGRVIPPEAVGEIAAAARAVGSAVLMDLAYAEFADEDPTKSLVELDNVVIVRTFSKAWGLAGLRLGYAVAPEPVCDWVRAAGGPFAVTGVSARAVELALTGDNAWANEQIERVRVTRGRLAGLLEQLGARPIGSQANFVLVRVGDAEAVERGLRGLGIAVRGFGVNPRLRGFLRVTVPTNEQDYTRLEKSLRSVEGVQR